ncbi:MAG TPA: hypothetical protein VI320_04220 [Terracidiphilus sp.]
MPDRAARVHWTLGHKDREIFLPWQDRSSALLTFELPVVRAKRAPTSVKRADAPVLATAPVAGVCAFVTSDFDLLRLSIPGVNFMLWLNYKAF